MSTRGFIAKSTRKNGVEGVYHHQDSYPSGLGKALWDAYHGFFAGNVRHMIAYLVDGEPVGWSNILGADFAEGPGWDDIPFDNLDLVPKRPGSTLPDWDAWRAMHGPQSFSARGDTIGGRETDCDGHIEWGYVLTPSGMRVWKALPEYGVGHVEVAYVRWAEPEPDWVALDG